MSNLQLEICIVSTPKLNHPLIYDDNALTHAVNDMTATWARFQTGGSEPALFECRLIYF